MSKLEQHTLRKNEQGIVSIILTVFVLIVLSLVVVAFSQNTRRNQKQALEQQLSTQAFYAAESGVNQVVNKFLKGELASVPETTSCDEGKRSLDTAETFTLSCLLYDSTPNDIMWTDVSTDRGQFVSLHTLGGAGIDALTLTWTKSQAGTGSYAGCATPGDLYTLPPLASYSNDCSAGILRVELIPYEPGITRDQITQKTYTVFLRPVNGAGGAAVFAYNQPDANGVENDLGNIVAANCVPNGRCSATITGIPTGGSMFMHLRSIYHGNKVTASGTLAGAPASFDQAQIKVDATGRANDVVRRIQVRKPLYPEYMIPASVLSATNGVCKQLGIAPASPYPAGFGTPAIANNDTCGGIL